MEKKTWLGLNDISTEGSFIWTDRGAGNFTAWAKNQPNNFGDEDCVHALGVKYNYEWNDVKCSDCHQFTCKKGEKMKTTTEKASPSTIGLYGRALPRMGYVCDARSVCESLRINYFLGRRKTL